jgi:hypothetical protein
MPTNSQSFARPLDSVKQMAEIAGPVCIPVLLARMISPERRFELLRIETGIFPIDDGKDLVGTRVDEDVGLAQIVVNEAECGLLRGGTWPSTLSPHAAPLRSGYRGNL